MTLPTILVLAVGGFSYLVLPFLIWMPRNNKTKTILSTIFFMLYLGVLVAGVLGQIAISKESISISFDFSGEWFAKTINTKVDFAAITQFDLIINLVMLVPVGMFVLFLARKKRVWLRFVLLCIFGLLSGALIEFMQFALPISRYVQVTDVLLNMASVLGGGIIAWLYLVLIKKIRKNPTL